MTHISDYPDHTHISGAAKTWRKKQMSKTHLIFCDRIASRELVRVIRGFRCAKRKCNDDLSLYHYPCLHFLNRSPTHFLQMSYSHGFRRGSSGPTKKRVGFNSLFCWRRERDLNPWIHSCITRFRIVRVRPLRHLCKSLIYSTITFPEKQAICTAFGDFFCVLRFFPQFGERRCVFGKVVLQ